MKKTKKLTAKQARQVKAFKALVSSFARLDAAVPRRELSEIQASFSDMKCKIAELVDEVLG